MRFGILAAALALTIAFAGELRANSASDIFELAFERYQQKDYEAALLLFEEGLKEDPSNGEANYYIGKLKMEWLGSFDDGDFERRNIIFSKTGGVAALIANFKTAYEKSTDSTLKVLALEQKLKLESQIEKRSSILNNENDMYFGYWYDYDSNYKDAIFCQYFRPVLKFADKMQYYEILKVNIEDSKFYSWSVDRNNPRTMTEKDRRKLKSIYWILWTSVLNVDLDGNRYILFPPNADELSYKYIKDIDGIHCGRR